eukprot:6193396-Pleurochrysis_carterae.AAC.3
MPLTEAQALKRLRGAGNTLEVGEQYMPRGSDSRKDVSCGCRLISPRTCKSLCRDAGHVMRKPEVAPRVKMVFTFVHSRVAIHPTLV